MQENEETVVDYAEVCVLRGSAQYIDTREYVSETLKKGSHLFGVTEFALGENDMVKLKLEDGTIIEIGPNEIYHLRTFETYQDRNYHQESVPAGRWHGWFRAYRNQAPGFLDTKLHFHKLLQ